MWRQIETAPPVGDHPIDLHHAGENRLTGKMAVKINQIARRDELEERALRDRARSTATAACSERAASVQAMR